MSDYTPDTEEVRINYIGTTAELAEGVPWKEARPGEFDRWLAEYTRQQREEAWTEAIYHVEPLIGLFTRRSVMEDNPYRKETP